MGSGKAGSNRAAAITPMKVPPLTPSSSGLAMGLLLTRCNRVPASASNTPAAPAASVRGKAPLQLGLPPQPARPTPAAHPCPNNRGGDHRRSQPQHHQADKAGRRRMAGQLQGGVCLRRTLLDTKTRDQPEQQRRPNRAVMAPVGISTGQNGSGSAAADRWPPATGRRGWVPTAAAGPVF